MTFSLPVELTDPMVRESDRISHGETLRIDLLSAEIDRRRLEWLADHPGWDYTGTNLVRCADGSPSPAYDVTLGFRRPRSAAELEVQTQDRVSHELRKQAEFHARAESQKALVDEVLSSIKGPR